MSFLEWETFHINLWSKSNKYFVYGDIFQTSCLLWDNVEKYCRARQAIDDNKIPRMCFVYLGNKAKNTYSEYAIPITCLWQQLLTERPWMLSCTYIACLVNSHTCLLLRSFDLSKVTTSNASIPIIIVKYTALVLPTLEVAGSYFGPDINFTLWGLCWPFGQITRWPLPYGIVHVSELKSVIQ